MKFLIFSAVCIAVVAAQYEPAPSPPETYPAPAPPSYPGPPSYPEPQPYPYPGDYDNDRERFRRLKNLRINGVTDARKRYFTRRDDDFVVISCPHNNANGNYTWLLADSRDTTPSFSLPGTVVLAGGLNIEYIAKLAHNGKWEGRDFYQDERQRFRRVGCFQGTVPSGLATVTTFTS